MRLTPIEIRQHRFSRRLRGFDPSEVEVFLEAVVADFEAVVRENAQLRQETERLHAELEAFRGREHTVQETLATAQTVVKELQQTAMKEAELKVGAAELQAEQLLREVEKRRAELDFEIRELRHIRERAESEVRTTLEGYLSLIDGFQQARTARSGDTDR